MQPALSRKRKIRRWIGMVLIAVPLVFLLNRPAQVFKTPYCTVLLDERNELLSVRIARDMQWRFPLSDSLPERYVTALRYYEDEHFYRHPGVNPVSLVKALYQNLRSKRIVRGGSTLSMQTIRLSRRGSGKRTLGNKLLEMALALRLELWYSKQDILKMYAAHAPMGGNIVGLEAASWRYFNRNASDLSWAEAALLSVLPNAPALIYPGKHSGTLRRKRNRLLDKLLAKGVIDAATCQLSKEELIPDVWHSLPAVAPHLLDRAIAEGLEGTWVRSTVSAAMQLKVNRIAAAYHDRLHQAEIHNMAIVVLRVSDGSVMAYCGNTDCPLEGSARDVDIVRASRSTGSILKPFLYEAVWRSGEDLPEMLLADIPIEIGGFRPRNFDEQYDGAVPANKALARSLNIPAVTRLQSYGLQRFHHDLQQLGLTTIQNTPEHYGLSLILGGAEGRLDELSTAYMNLSRCLQEKSCLHGMTYRAGVQAPETGKHHFDRGSTWWVTQALSTLNRPAEEGGWEHFQSARRVAWKTGTSFGFRDAWSIGYTADHVVGVWVGNADGEGRPGLTGVQVAAPVMFGVFQHLQEQNSFQEPFGRLKEMEVCAESGWLKGPLCTETKARRYPVRGLRAGICRYHRTVHLNESGTRQVHAQCYPQQNMIHQNYFVLPPVMAWYYKRINPAYPTLPPYQPGCDPPEQGSLHFIYPAEKGRIAIPRTLEGKKSRTVAELAHSHPYRTVYWHLDRQFLGSTVQEHRMEFIAESGPHVLSAVDEAGQQTKVHFRIVNP